ncbi:Hypothetical predicted protein [Cloeon dipterum]|uniref:BTB domain-containing protein n=1 Tax=Cloeon dipterum TaxID=197152 RepID=A0A8S1D986_9INSE|nr:Hypothetical predicted protein [Cloeon dipterum]
MADGNLGKVAAKKLKALQDGLYTDVVFLVGEQDESSEEIHAVSFDLSVSSMYFVKLLNSPLTLKIDGKFRLKNIEPKIFKLIVKFTHLSEQLVPDVDSLETCLKLASAAEEYVIDDLAELCSKLLEDQFLKVDNVWDVLSEHHLVNGIASSCLQFLRSETSECLKHQSFLDASEEAIKLFLTLTKMCISSESELLAACLWYASSKEDEKDVFRRCFLRDIRILVLDSVDLAKLARFLTLEEKLSFVSLTSPLMNTGEASVLLPSLCSITEGRSEEIKIVGEHTLTLIPDSQILDPREIYLNLPEFDRHVMHYYYQLSVHDAYSLSLQPKTSIKILGFEIFNDLNFPHIASGSAEIFARKSQQYTFECYVSSPREFGELLVDQWVAQDEFSTTDCGSWSYIKLSTLVPAGATFTLKAWLKNSAYLRRLSFSEEILRSINRKETVNAIAHVHIGTFVVNENYGSVCETKKLADDTYCVFKSIRFADKDYK